MLVECVRFACATNAAHWLSPSLGFMYCSRREPGLPTRLFHRILPRRLARRRPSSSGEVGALGGLHALERDIDSRGGAANGFFVVVVAAVVGETACAMGSVDLNNTKKQRDIVGMDATPLRTHPSA